MTGTLRTSHVGEGDDALRLRLAVDGYLYFTNIISRSKIAKARARGISICKKAGWLKGPGTSGAPFQADAWLHDQATSVDARQRFLRAWGTEARAWTHTPVYASIHQDRRLLRLLARLLGERAVPHPLLEARGARFGFPAVCRILPAAHQDASYLRDPHEAYTIWVPIGDCPKKLGGLALWPRSQTRGLLPHTGGRGIPDEHIEGASFRSADYRAGDVLVFGMYTVHKALPNRTNDTMRLSMDFRYCPASAISPRLLADPRYGALDFADIKTEKNLVVHARTQSRRS